MGQRVNHIIIDRAGETGYVWVLNVRVRICGAVRKHSGLGGRQRQVSVLSLLFMAVMALNKSLNHSKPEK